MTPSEKIQKKKRWSVYGSVVGTKWMGYVEAETEKEAEQKAVDELEWSVSVCHHCSKNVSDPEIQEINVEEVDDDSE